MTLRRPWLLWTVAALLAAAGGAWLARALNEPPQLRSGTWLPAARALERFALTDQQGHRFANEQLLGAPTLVYFGFTNCPEVCPTTLAVLADVLRSKPLPGLRVLFVTIDPERDTPLVLQGYLRAFGSDFIGVTGAAPALAPLTHSLTVAAERHPLPDGSYTMDHSSVVYLIDPRGRFAAVFTPPLSSAAITADLASLRSRLRS